jgi:hypothetical protein
MKKMLEITASWFLFFLGSEVVRQALRGAEGSRRLPPGWSTQGDVRLRTGPPEQHKEEHAMGSGNKSTLFFGVLKYLG